MTINLQRFRALLPLSVLAATCIAPATAQDPKPRPKSSVAGSSSGSRATPAAKSPYDGPATLLFQVDMACRIWIDGVLATASDSGVKPIKVSIGDHLVKVETTDGLVSWQRAINVPRAEQQIVSTELAKEWRAADAARRAAAAEAPDAKDVAWLRRTATGTFDCETNPDLETWFRTTQMLDVRDCRLTLVEETKIGRGRGRSTLSSRYIYERRRTWIELGSLDIEQVKKPVNYHYADSDPSPLYDVSISVSPGVTATWETLDPDGTVSRSTTEHVAGFYVAGEEQASSVWATIRKLARECR